ncbi:hypothetical protein [Liquorilactobacillus mali]|uniref:Neutral/alkaline non-lysosomal ceramidase N-terminal domain-containing protein n=1 Tax=Liquorilactobacillus mali KCTC 3596 = DSM 20444 TaxID=1046596 RepID=J0KX47_9LACO|nr:hypothetical protein [Liquorilactobacillus mali]EJE97978.1 hypothetical protein LMA_08673 [Liquorilactobacillus mali KCTC 3596 = DSM 20444]KRN09175.1 hypothetical protein FD00_GL001366 [Liquorilactobacillus mali KCTC 3596 = DSM 20444]MDV7757359.1 hypothetical protein [Liquorilactobacillus mali]
MLKAGFGKKVIDFKKSDLPLREFSKKLDDLYTRVMLVDGTQQHFALVSLDLTSLPAKAINTFKNIVAELTNIDVTNIWITVSHTFAAPHLPNAPKSETDHKNYQFIFDRLKSSLTASCEAAQLDLQSVQIASTMVNCPLNVNRNQLTAAGWWLGRDLNAYSDHHLRVLAFKKDDGTVNLIVNYDIQQSVLDHITDDEGNRVISSDLMGVGIKKYEDLQQIAIFLPGAAGDQRPLFVGNNKKPFAFAKALLSEQSVLVYESLQNAVHSISNWQLFKKLRLQTQIISAPTQVQKLSTFEIKPTHHYDFKSTGMTIPLDVTALQLNQYLIIGTQPEMNSSFGAECRQTLGLGEDVMLATLVNGGAKYLPEKLDYQRTTYQAMNTKLAQGTDELFLAAFAHLGKKINKEEEL